MQSLLVLFTGDCDKNGPNVRPVRCVRPYWISAFVIGCCARLTCLFFTSLQQSTVNQILIFQPFHPLTVFALQ